MAESFDPYHKWLGIPPAEQPPHAYRLLAIQAFESDLDVIETAAEQRMALLRTRQTGAQSQLSQKLLNEVSAARVTLLNPAKKAAYDQQLKATQAAAQQATAQKELRTREAMPIAKALPVKAAVMPVAPQPPAAVPEIQFDPSGASAIRTGHGTKKKSASPLVFAAIGIGVILIGGLAFMLMSGGNAPEKTPANPAGGETLAQKTENPGTEQGTSPTSDPTQPVVTDSGSPPEKETSKTKQPDPAEEKVVATQPQPMDPADPATNEKTSDVTAENPAEVPDPAGSAANAQPWPFDTPTVDLLASARELPAADVAGWKQENDTFVSPATGDARLPLTDKSLDAYRLSFEVERTGGTGPVAIGFPILGRQFVYVFDGADGGHSGLDGWEGKSYTDNPTTRTGNLLSSNKLAKIDIEARPDQLSILVDGKVVFNEQLVLGPWRTLRASSLTAEEGSKFKPMEDGSYVLIPPFLDRDTYTFEAPVGNSQIAAIRLEALPDVSLPIKGPGAHSSGNFVMGAVELSAKSSSASSQEFKKLPLIEGLADFNQGGFDAASCVVNGQPGWAIHPGVGKRHAAVFMLNQPMDRAAIIRFKMPFLSGGQSMLGRFRISVASSLGGARRFPFVATTLVAPINTIWQKNKLPGVFVATSETSVRIAQAQASRLSANEVHRPIDLLTKIDPDRDRFNGTWTMQNGQLRVDDPGSRLILPVTSVPPSYKLSLRVKRLNEQQDGVFGIGFPIGENQGFFHLGYGGISGLHNLDGKSFNSNESTHSGRLFELGKETHFDLIVRGNHILLLADGKTICDWKGDPTRISVQGGWDVPDTKSLYLAGDTPHTISAIEFTPLSSSGSGAGIATSEPAEQPAEIPEASVTLLSPPSNDELIAARKAMREKYADIFADAKKPEEKLKLVEALTQQGQAQFDDLLERYVLLEEARTLAEDLGNYQLTVKAIDALAETHQVNSDALTASAFMAAIKKVKTPAENAAAARVGLDLIDQLTESNLEAAESIRKALPGLAAKARDGDLLRDVKNVGAGLILRKKLFDAYLAAEQLLKKDPKDKAANLAVGTYLAVCTEETDLALKHLSQGNDDKLAALAKAEAAAPKDAESQLALAEQWQAWGTSAGGDLKTFTLEAAVRWYEAAAPSLTGLKKAKVDKDLAEVREALKGAAKVTKKARASQGRTLKVVSARFGAEGAWTDGTKDLAALVKDERLVASAIGERRVTTEITLRIGGEEVKQEFRGGDHILIEAPGRQRPRAASRDLTILDARAGLGLKWEDITEGVQKRVQGNRLEMRVNTLEFAHEDLAPGVLKLLFVHYSYNGQEHTEFFPEGTTVSLGAAK